jgi:hypothetical protein
MGILHWICIGDLHFSLHNDVTYFVAPSLIDGDCRWGVWYPNTDADDTPDEVHMTARRAISQAQKHYDRNYQ